jgi:uncharacterized lipoprotein
MRSIPHASARAITLALLSVALVASSGCGWFRGKSVYEQSPESRPLEVPPDLDSPRVDPAMNIPGVAAPRAAPSVAAPPAASGAPLVISDSPDSVWRRVGLALERIDGVEIVDRAQLISAYNVRYQGEEFLLMISADAAGSRITSTTADGRVAAGPGAARLLGLLRQRLS